ncbi:hypothetical protein AAFF_G00392030 [Aldrovandia affinis]|uniref:Uncharacterized protein n=1 Tax=Aldrovandia affinis TaxID=143900 RepID=A0AAD7SE66_9TELE|nr:hypothetical protein AAFF_G00392030 [Aldrovandia affinis]
MSIANDAGIGASVSSPPFRVCRPQCAVPRGVWRESQSRHRPPTDKEKDKGKMHARDLTGHSLFTALVCAVLGRVEESGGLCGHTHGGLSERCQAGRKWGGRRVLYSLFHRGGGGQAVSRVTQVSQGAVAVMKGLSAARQARGPTDSGGLWAASCTRRSLFHNSERLSPRFGRQSRPAPGQLPARRAPCATPLRAGDNPEAMGASARGHSQLSIRVEKEGTARARIAVARLQLSLRPACQSDREHLIPSQSRRQEELQWDTCRDLYTATQGLGLLSVLLCGPLHRGLS